jgi:glutamate formiminotransferase
MHLLGQAQIVIPAWEPDMGWRVLDPDGHLVEAGPKTFLVAEFNLAIPGLDINQVPMLGAGQER